MIKIAFLLTGTVRNYKMNLETWKTYLLDLFDVDVFFHTYDVYGFQKAKTQGNVEPEMHQKVDVAELVRLLGAKRFVVDCLDKKLGEFRMQIPQQFINNGIALPEYIKAQLYSIYVANKLKMEYEKENDFVYDIVIKIRFDTVFNSPFDLFDFEIILSNKQVILCGNPNIGAMSYKNACLNCIKNYNYWEPKSCLNHSIVSDIVYISISQNIDFYASLFLHYDLIVINHYKKYLDYGHQKYISKIYPNGSILYKNVPGVKLLFPELVLSSYLKNYILLNYGLGVDTNRKKNH